MYREQYGEYAYWCWSVKGYVKKTKLVVKKIAKPSMLSDFIQETIMKCLGLFSAG